MMKAFPFSLLVFLSMSVSGQMLDTSRPLDLENWVCFNADFLHANGIDTVMIKSQSKRTGRPMRHSNDKQLLTFDAMGRLTSTFETRAVAHLTDSSASTLTYGLHDHWTEKHESSASGTYTFLPKLDSAGRLENLQCWKGKGSNQALVNEEHYKWVHSDSTVSMTAYNNYNLPYERHTTCTSPEGFLLWTTTEFVVTHRIKHTAFTYNEQAWLSEVTFSTSHSDRVEKHTYIYDGVGNLSQVEVRKNGTHQTTYEIVYDDLDRIDGIIKVNKATNAMDILNFTYPQTP